MNEEIIEEEYGAQDNSGLDEIQKAFDEINKLNKESENDSETEEDEEVAEGENEQEPEEELEPEEIPIKEEKKVSKIWKEKKRKYQAIAEKEALRQENERLKEMLSESLNSGTYHYSKSAYADLEKAKNNQKKAIEDGDLESLVEAQVSLTKAVNAINDLEKWSYNEEQRGVQSPNTNYNAQSNYISEREQEIVKDWLEEHPYLEPSSRNYDNKVANKVADFVNALDNNLTNHGNRDAVFSEEYFDTIDNYISKIRRDSSKVSKNLDGMAPVGSVRNSYTSTASTNGSRTTQMILTADEKKMAANAGISEKEWLKYKLEDSKKGK